MKEKYHPFIHRLTRQIPLLPKTLTNPPNSSIFMKPFNLQKSTNPPPVLELFKRIGNPVIWKIPVLLFRMLLPQVYSMCLLIALYSIMLRVAVAGYCLCAAGIVAPGLPDSANPINPSIPINPNAGNYPPYIQCRRSTGLTCGPGPKRPVLPLSPPPHPTLPACASGVGGRSKLLQEALQRWQH